MDKEQTTISMEQIMACSFDFSNRGRAEQSDTTEAESDNTTEKFETLGATAFSFNDCEEITVSFKKTINVRQYESEVTEAYTTLKLPRNITGGERMLCLAIVQAQLEYEVFCTLAYKQFIKQTELSTRKKDLECAVTALYNKAEQTSGRSMAFLFD